MCLIVIMYVYVCFKECVCVLCYVCLCITLACLWASPRPLYTPNYTIPHGDSSISTISNKSDVLAFQEKQIAVAFLHVGKESLYVRTGLHRVGCEILGVASSAAANCGSLIGANQMRRGEGLSVPYSRVIFTPEL